MMKKYNPTNDLKLIKLCEITSTENTEDAWRTALVRHEASVAAELCKLGFTEVCDTRSNGPDAPGLPQFTAVMGKRPCCICMPEEVESVMRLRALRREQCEYCERNMPEHDVYYAALTVADGTLYLVAPHPVRYRGEWLVNDSETAQFLPISMREYYDSYAPLLGDAAGVKMTEVIMPLMLREGVVAECRIGGLNTAPRRGKAQYYILHRGGQPSLPLLLCREKKNESRLCRPFFSYAHEFFTEMELAGVDAEEPENGLVELMTRKGEMFYAESLEAAALPGVLPVGARYKWSLSVVAQKIRIMEREFGVTEGAIFEQAKADYRREHGMTPPRNFSLRVPTGNLRMSQQDERSSLITLCGQVAELREVQMFDLHYTVAIVRFLPDDDEAMLGVLISDAVLGKSRPSVGDTLTCMGEMYATPIALTSTAGTWRDLPELIAERERRERSEMVRDAYAQLSKSSMALGVAVSSFLAAGWDLAETLPLHFLTQRLPLRFRNPQGEMVNVYVDTFVDGFSPRPSSEELAEAEHAVYCRVRLEYHPKQDRYRVSMTTQPEQPEVRCSLTMAVTPLEYLAPTAYGEDAEWDLPEQLDERMAARLLRSAVENADGTGWLGFSEWLREEASFMSEVSSGRVMGKVNILRYLAEFAGRHPADKWTWRLGSILLRGESRPALAIYLGDELYGYAVFDDKRGMIGGIRIIFPSSDCPFTQDAESAEENSEAAVFARRMRGAVAGDARAQYEVALSLEHGIGTEKNMTEAVRWYRASAEQGCAEAQFGLACCCDFGEGTAQDVHEAVRWYRAAAEQGHAMAQCNLGYHYDLGDGVEKDLAAAARWYRSAAELGYDIAQINIALCYYIGKGVKRDMAEVERWLLAAAKQGLVEAQFRLAELYREAEEPEKAVLWYRAAAEQGDDESQFRLAWCHYFGVGVERNMAEAALLFRSAADHGHAMAQFYLGRCYENGHGVDRDLAEAVRLYRRSADRGDAMALCSLGLLYAEGKGVKQSNTKAAQFFRKAADQDDPVALYQLGRCYLLGSGVKKNVSKARSYLLRSAELGNDAARSLLRESDAEDNQD